MLRVRWMVRVRVKEMVREMVRVMFRGCRVGGCCCVVRKPSCVGG